MALTAAEERPDGAQSIRRAVRVLRFVAAGGDKGRRLTEVATEAGLHVATAHRILGTLAGEGLLLHAKADKSYRLGPQLIALAAQADAQFAIRELFRPALQAIAAETGDTAFLQIRSGDETICLARVEGAYPVRTLTLDVGGRRPLAATAGGLAILSALGDTEVATMLTRNGTGFRGDAAKLRRTVAGARRLGYVSFNGRAADMSVASIGVRLTDQAGGAVAVSVTALPGRMGPQRRRVVAATIRAAVAGLAGFSLAPALAERQ